MESMELTQFTRGGRGKELEKLKNQADLYNSEARWNWNIASNSTVFSDKIQTVSRLQKISNEGRDYSGILYTNRLRASRAINIRGLGFYGPSDKGVGCYSVDIEIEEEFSQSKEPPRKIISITKQAVTTEREDIFFYDFPTPPVILQPNHWYSIKFQLDGPPTCQGSIHLPTAKVGNVRFDFHYGSNQMPQIRFTTL